MPDFCKNTSILIIVIVAVLMSMVITLLSNTSPSIADFSMTSLYIVWLFVMWTGCLCLVGKLNKSHNIRYILCVTTCLVSFLAYELIVQEIYLYNFDIARLLRLSIIAVLFLLVSIRGLQLITIYSERSRADLQTKLSALQSKIEPHFLFNSLNTIAELTHINPEQAESAINSLATILRSNLKNDDAFHSAEEEIILCEKYIELEKWRLADKLKTTIKIDNNAKSAIIPKLIFQPLIENAVRHGVAPFPDGGKISIKVSRSGKQIIATINNTSNTKNSIREENTLQGHGIAVKNVRERLFVIYDDRYRIKARESGNSYIVELQFPSTPPKQMI
jgi:two-component system sensor histidine kinase AlgZ